MTGSICSPTSPAPGGSCAQASPTIKAPCPMQCDARRACPTTTAPGCPSARAVRSRGPCGSMWPTPTSSSKTPRFRTPSNPPCRNCATPCQAATIHRLTSCRRNSCGRCDRVVQRRLIAAAVCVYAVGYRFSSAFIAAKVLALDPTRATPAERLNDGRDFVLTNKWVVFGHHFAAIAGPGPLIGPARAARGGGRPGAGGGGGGAGRGGGGQDFVTLFFSTRRN